MSLSWWDVCTSVDQSLKVIPSNRSVTAFHLQISLTLLQLVFQSKNYGGSICSQMGRLPEKSWYNLSWKILLMVMISETIFWQKFYLPLPLPLRYNNASPFLAKLYFRFSKTPKQVTKLPDTSASPLPINFSFQKDRSARNQSGHSVLIFQFNSWLNWDWDESRLNWDYSGKKPYKSGFGVLIVCSTTLPLWTLIEAMNWLNSVQWEIPKTDFVKVLFVLRRPDWIVR